MIPKVFIVISLLTYSYLAQAEVDDALLDYNNETVERTTQSLDYKPEKQEFVVVESLNVQVERKSGEYKLLPYNVRRGKWGGSVSFGMSQYNPINYEPDNSPQLFEDHYGNANQAMAELMFTYRRNFSMMSVGLELGAGSMKTNSSDIATAESTLSLQIYRFGLSIDLDNLTTDALIVPYASGGGYVAVYDESYELLSNPGVKGSTTVAPYYSFGVKFNLNWLEKDTARIAYEENGIENSFIYVDARQYMRSSTEQDKYFDTDLSLSAGFSVEF